MLNAYSLLPTGPRHIPGPDMEEDGRIGWIDLVNPTQEEDRLAERFLGVAIPTREEAQEIEFSSRFYHDGDAQYLTLSIVAGIDAEEPILTPLSFVLSNGKLATVRYADFAALRQFIARLPKIGDTCTDSAGVMVGLIEAVIDRIADIIEKTGAEIDRLNKDIFRRGSRPKASGGKKRERQLELFLGEIGYQNDVVSKTRESLASIERMLQFVSATGIAGEAKGAGPSTAARPKVDAGRYKLMARDVRSLTDHLSFLSNRSTFLLEATLGLISVQQNEVIRVLTVAATILLPPTLIGTVYGMNFDNMPELHWTIGYPLAVLLMGVSALLPYLILKKRGWF